MMRGIRAEFFKLKDSTVTLWTALAVAGYAITSVAVASAIKSGQFARSLTEMGDIYAVAVAQGLYTPTWEHVLRLNVQAVAAAWGPMLCGFVAAYVFGRERKDGTDGTLLTSPVPRWAFASAKLIVVAAWVLALTVLAFFLQTVGFACLGFDAFSWTHLARSMGQMLVATALIYSVLPLVGLISLHGKPGYLKPILFTLVAWALGNSLLETEYAHLYPLSAAVLIEGAAWLPLVPGEITITTWIVATAVFIVGVVAVMWKLGRADDAR